ncbi:MAG: ABC transporter, permease protein 2 (cluster 1, maltose/g3p/polyamine/iron), partial [uncultured Nocardioidaceae bacterium]
EPRVALRRLGGAHPAVREPPAVHDLDVLQGPAGVGADTADLVPAEPDVERLRPDPHRHGHAGVPVVRELDAGRFPQRAARGGHRGTGCVRPGPDGVPRAQGGLRDDRGHAVRTTGDPGDPELRDRGAAAVAGHADRGDRADRRERLRRLLPAPVLPAASQGARGVGIPRRGQHLAGLLPRGAAAVPAGAGHAGAAGVPDQLERLLVAGLRVVQSGEPDAAGRAEHAAVGQRRALRPADGGRRDREPPGADPLRVRTAVRDRGRLALRAEGV